MKGERAFNLNSALITIGLGLTAWTLIQVVNLGQSSVRNETQIASDEKDISELKTGEATLFKSVGEVKESIATENGRWLDGRQR